MSVRVALIGAGRMGQAHLHNLRQMQDVEIVAIADVVEETARRVASEVGARWYTDHEELLNAEELDAAYVVTPAQHHAEAAVAVANAGVHLFCEKPLAWTVAEGKRIVGAVERAGILAAVGYQWRYLPIVDEARKILGGSPIALFRAHYYWTVPLVESIRNKGRGGGQIFDQGTHLIDLARYFGGDPERIYARYTLNAHSWEEFDNWDGYAVAMNFRSGAVGTVSTTYALFPAISEPPTLDIVAKDLLVRFTADALRVYRPDSETILRNRGGSTIDHAFIEAVRQGDPSLIRSTPADALRTLAATLGCNRSAELGREVTLEEVLG